MGEVYINPKSSGCFTMLGIGQKGLSGCETSWCQDTRFAPAGFYSRCQEGSLLVEQLASKRFFM